MRKAAPGQITACGAGIKDQTTVDLGSDGVAIATLVLPAIGSQKQAWKEVSVPNLHG